MGMKQRLQVFSALMSFFTSLLFELILLKVERYFITLCNFYWQRLLVGFSMVFKR